MKKRLLKTQPLYRRLAYRETKIVPSLSMSGKWLIDAGFPIHTEVSVIVEAGKITIQPAS